MEITEIISENEFDKLRDRLCAWRKDRDLDTSVQFMNSKGNFFEEVSEYHRATSIEGDDGKIDALCDMFIFSMNATNSSYEDLVKSEFVPGLVSVLLGNPRHSEFHYLIKMVLSEIYDLGYSPYEAISEAIKHIESRTGQWNDSLGKWKKHEGAYSVDEAIEVAKKNASEVGNTIVEVLGVREVPTDDTKTGWWYDVEAVVESGDKRATVNYHIKMWVKPNYSETRRQYA